MYHFGSWLRNIGSRITSGLRRFMTGRYGTDKLNTAILGSGVALCLICLFVRTPLISLLFTSASYGLMIWAIFRSLSRNTYKRYQENRRFLLLIDRVKDRQHRYFSCPRCRQPVRVPKGKGKISITCPKCKEKFIKKT